MQNLLHTLGGAYDMIIAIVIAATISILIGMIGKEVKYWEGKPMDNTNIIPIVILIMALTAFLSIL